MSGDFWGQITKREGVKQSSSLPSELKQASSPKASKNDALEKVEGGQIIPQVFISYTHDSEEHKDRVLSLANRLRSEGIDCNIDQYEQSPSEGWLRWMLNQLELADFVLVVCTEIYNRRFRGLEEAQKGQSVTWQGAVISQEMYDDFGENTKFIPVVFATEYEEYIPFVIKGFTCYKLDSEKGYESLYRHLTKQPEIIKPDLGKLRNLPHRKRESLFQESSTIGKYSEEITFIDLEEKFPSNVAILYVLEQENNYFLRLHNIAWDNPKETETSPPPPITLSQLINSQQRASEILGQLQRYRSRCPIGKLLGWLRELEELSDLIINDGTDFVIPWEMLPLRQQPLGIRVNLIRWLDIPDLENWDKIYSIPSPQSSADCCQGDVLIYAKTEELEEIKSLKSYQSVCFSENQAFLTHLKEKKETIGLVYIARHGFLETTFSQKILSYDSFNCYLQGIEFSSYYSSIIFMNACHFELIRDQFSKGYRVGFITSFLERGAKGVIGTLTEVEENYATLISQEFFQEYEKNYRLTVPQILRSLRDRIYQRLRDEPGNEDICALYFYTFMYVYYGHPNVFLKLSLAEG
ncbi:SEFIR domain-containing protein [Gloeothece verrucosa]|uniref:SEFIR domain protein n=1 Tax=Gloeothece verrucosa (strain PCC 7822) TaxID=497965 RepID=E0U8A2_GLOV7|nr:SEFIR domain-containing protein [Gloeothece verrucosa]ADN12538.1 SEFIR domain protein [Gloeothece verrucosa PCC 7822]